MILKLICSHCGIPNTREVSDDLPAYRLSCYRCHHSVLLNFEQPSPRSYGMGTWDEESSGEVRDHAMSHEAEEEEKDK